MTYDSIKAYQQTTAHSAQYSDPYTLVGMLMDNFIQRMARSKVHLEQKDYMAKGHEIDRALAILHALQGTLDHSQGSEIAANLDSLYDYMQRQVLLASARKDTELLDEMASLMRDIKDGWDGIGPQPDAGSAAEEPASEAPEGPKPRISVSG